MDWNIDTTKNWERREIPINGTLRARLEGLAFNNVEGHKILTMTLRYAQIAPSHKVRALEVLDIKLGQN